MVAKSVWIKTHSRLVGMIRSSQPASVRSVRFVAEENTVASVWPVRLTANSMVTPKPRTM